MTNDQLHLDLMRRFAVFWSARDADGCMACFSEDAVFAASAGPEPGTTYAGKAAIRAKLQEIFEDPANAPLVSGRFFTMGDAGMMEWVLDRQMPDGTVKTFRGIDIYEFDGGLIRLKDSYRKCL
ncbi:nuclear transport factor 2 family protein [Labrys neptuniae]